MTNALKPSTGPNLGHKAMKQIMTGSWGPSMKRYRIGAHVLRIAVSVRSAGSDHIPPTQLRQDAKKNPARGGMSAHKENLKSEHTRGGNLSGL